MLEVSIESKPKHAVAVFRLQRGATNAIHPNLVVELERALGELASEPRVRAVVLAGGEKFFSIGFDLPHLLTLPEPEFAEFYRAFNRLCLNLYRLPLPTVAALAGHATAGGCILALCCDYRLIAEGRRLIGLNEIKLGLPVPYPADRMLHALVGSRRARLVLESGEFYDPPAALEIGLVDRVVPPADLRSEALALAASLAEMPGEAFDQIKANRVQPTLQAIETGLDERERVFIRCWSSAAAQPLLFDAATKF
jgi:enoyl-CoA hydratase/carnithine racemase